MCDTCSFPYQLLLYVLCSPSNTIFNIRFPFDLFCTHTLFNTHLKWWNETSKRYSISKGRPIILWHRRKWGAFHKKTYYLNMYILELEQKQNKMRKGEKKRKKNKIMSCNRWKDSKKETKMARINANKKIEKKRGTRVAIRYWELCFV